jgi:HEAT repeat protein
VTAPVPAGADRRREVAIAGHTGDATTARRALDDPDSAVRATALGALERLGRLDDGQLIAAFADPDPAVRRRAASIAAGHRDVDLGPLLADDDEAVVEMAAWACGEHEHVSNEVLDALRSLAGESGEALVRESAVAALGAIGDDRGLDTILTATGDRPAVRRRAVLALAPFVGPDHPRAAEVRAALDRALADRDWQVRQAAEDLLVSGDG